MSSLIEIYKEVRAYSLAICGALEPEDFTCQPELFVSPPKWHLAHSTWFFENFVLQPNAFQHKPFHPKFHFLFNSYYETAGEHLLRPNRGALTRPTIDTIREYRLYVDERMEDLLAKDPGDELQQLIITGLHHEQQHQELLLMDIKYILGYNPLFPPYNVNALPALKKDSGENKEIKITGGVYTIGHEGTAFAFDNEGPAQKVFVHPFKISTRLVSNKEYLNFILDGGYQRVDLWHSDAWEWINNAKIKSPLYWHKSNDVWHAYTYKGLHPVTPDEPVMHVSFYEAFAYAAWKGKRLPTEFEWEVASSQFNWGNLWEHTMSAYLPYHGYKKPEGTLGEYNAKFMANQMVLRGASFATPAGHARKTYRNFFSPELQWQFAGIRLAE